MVGFGSVYLFVGLVVVAGLLAVGWLMARTTRRQPRKQTPQRPAPALPAQHRLAAVASWGYQLQHLDIEHAATAPFDLLVVDYSLDGSDARALTRDEVDRLRKRPGYPDRIVLAYLSVGEAESYRFYWQQRWRRQPPAWLLSENPDWAENFAIAFWDPGWQSIIFGSPESYLDRVIAAGFDGVYLDKCDVFEDLARREPAVAAARADPAGDMVRFVAALSAYAKARDANFAIFMQNAESLLDDPSLIATLDGAAKEELFFGQSGGQARNHQEDVRWSAGQLDKAKAAGCLVLVVEYVSGAKRIAEAERKAAERGYVLAIADPDRELDRLDFDVPVG